jgi:hypothetical protein
VLAAAPVRDSLQAHPAVDHVAERAPRATPTLLLVRTTTSRCAEGDQLRHRPGGPRVDVPRRGRRVVGATASAGAGAARPTDPIRLLRCARWRLERPADRRGAARKQSGGRGLARFRRPRTASGALPTLHDEQTRPRHGRLSRRAVAAVLRLGRVGGALVADGSAGAHRVRERARDWPAAASPGCWFVVMAVRRPRLLDALIRWAIRRRVERSYP